MKMELWVGGKVVVIEADGAFSVHVRDVSPPDAAIASVPGAAPVVGPVAVPEVAAGAVPEAVAVAAAPAGSGASGGMFARLADLRRELSAAANVPPYVVFKDSTLREMAEKLPQDLAEFGEISGVGKAKLEKYGDLFLAVIKGEAA